jgi:glyoxylase-like metal-dependent hydrolase (beta-lactamase superfamily II)
MMRNEVEAASGVLHVRTMMVNVYLVRTERSWVLVDAGLGGYATTIRAAARRYIGSDAPPAAIVLTHAHFDHVGSLETLLEAWDVPVFAHRLERPYLTGRSPYPPPDPLVGRGGMAWLSRLYPRGPIDVSRSLRTLPESGEVPDAPEWRWIHTPGHTAGHVSLFRDRDRVVIAGDAVTTTKQESTLAVATQRRELHGPPAYYTQDWRAAAESVGRLAALEPEVLATGHGDPLAGAGMRQDLRRLAATFDEREVPAFGRYAKQPAVTDEQGIVRLPPDPLPRVVAGVATAAAVAWTVAIGTARARRAAPRTARGS